MTISTHGITAKDPHVEVRVSDVLANERTFLAYIRTSLAFIGFGFVIARFGLFLKEFGAVTHLSTSTHYSSQFGIGMALFGVLIGVLGGWRYAATDRGLRRGTTLAMSRALGYVVTIAVAAVGLTVAILLLSYH